MRSLTLAALQMSCGPDRTENLEKAASLVREAARPGRKGNPPARALRGPLLLPGRGSPPSGTGKASRGPPGDHAHAGARPRTRRRHPRELLRACRTGPLQLAGDDRCRWQRAGHLPQEPYSAGLGLPGEILLLSRRYRLPRLANPARRIGAGICWDQWFPEAARAMALGGAEVLLYPTAIGSELLDPQWDSAPHWQRVMQGHAGANLMPLVAANRVGTEHGLNGTKLTFYGSSFIADPTGAKVSEAHPHGRNRAHRDLRPRANRRVARLLGRVPRPATGAVRRAVHTRRNVGQVSGSAMKPLPPTALASTPAADGFRMPGRVRAPRRLLDAVADATR